MCSRFFRKKKRSSLLTRDKGPRRVGKASNPGSARERSPLKKSCPIWNQARFRRGAVGGTRVGQECRAKGQCGGRHDAASFGCSVLHSLKKSTDVMEFSLPRHLSNWTPECLQRHFGVRQGSVAGTGCTCEMLQVCLDLERRSGWCRKVWRGSSARKWNGHALFPFQFALSIRAAPIV